jgi:predicted nucleotide-binding protein
MGTRTSKTTIADLSKSSRVSRSVAAWPNNKVFVVHGQDAAAKQELARFLERLGLEPIILHEQANAGATIIEKLERHLEVAYAVVLVTPDDVGAPAATPSVLRPRARQNVWFELGLFVGALGRSHVCVLHKGSAEVLSDYQGVVYVPMDERDGWKIALARELKVIGLPIDMNLAF